MTALRKHSIATRLPRKAVGVTAKLRAEVKAEKLRKLVIEEGAYEAVEAAICPRKTTDHAGLKAPELLVICVQE